MKPAVEENVEFEVPELYLEQGQEEYDLAAGLAYDESKYILDVKDDGNFDIMLSGEYRVTFVLDSLEETQDPPEETQASPEETQASPEETQVSQIGRAHV